MLTVSKPDESERLIQRNRELSDLSEKLINPILENPAEYERLVQRSSDLLSCISHNFRLTVACVCSQNVLTSLSQSAFGVFRCCCCFEYAN